MVVFLCVGILWEFVMMKSSARWTSTTSFTRSTPNIRRSPPTPCAATSSGKPPSTRTESAVRVTVTGMSTGRVTPWREKVPCSTAGVPSGPNGASRRTRWSPRSGWSGYRSASTADRMSRSRCELPVRSAPTGASTHPLDGPVPGPMNAAPASCDVRPVKSPTVAWAVNRRLPSRSSADAALFLRLEWYGAPSVAGDGAGSEERDGERPS